MTLRRTILVLVLFVMCLTTVYAVSAFDVMQVASNSMEQTLHTGDYIVVKRMGPGTWSHWSPTLARGQIIVFRKPDEPKRIMVKRIIATGGEQVSINQGSLIVDGVAVVEPYVSHRAAYNPSTDSWPRGWGREDLHSITVPPQSYFVLGDSRDGSLDSRVFGSVPVNDVIGVVLFEGNH